MRLTNYESPSVEVIEIEIEDAVLSDSGLEGFSSGILFGEE